MPSVDPQEAKNVPQSVPIHVNWFYDDTLGYSTV